MVQNGKLGISKTWKGVVDLNPNKKVVPPKNPNKRPCVARNITFSVQRETEQLLRLHSKRPRFMSEGYSKD